MGKNATSVLIYVNLLQVKKILSVTFLLNFHRRQVGPVGAVFYQGEEFVPQRRVPFRNDPCGSDCLRALFSQNRSFENFAPPPDGPISGRFIRWLGGWMAVFTFQHFGPYQDNFFEVLSVVRFLGWRGIDFKIGLSTYKAIFEHLGLKYN